MRSPSAEGHETAELQSTELRPPRLVWCRQARTRSAVHARPGLWTLTALWSTAAMFPGWAEYGDEPFLWRGPPTYDPLVVYQPKTWLLREGWTKASSISCHEVPSKQ